MIDRSGDRPVYRQLAALLRERIESGVYAPGDVLPAESALIEEHDVSRGTVRQAIALLRAEGLVVTEHARGTFVRDRLPVKRISSDRYRIAAGTVATSFTRDQNIDWTDYRLDKTFREVPASEDLADLLEVPAGTPLLERRFVFYAGDVPQQMSLSCYPLELVAGTPVADPANEPWPGGSIAQLATLGVGVARIRESVKARMPMPDEAATLAIPAMVPVFAITRRMWDTAGRVVEAAVDIVIPADRAVLDYDIDLTVPPT